MRRWLVRSWLVRGLVYLREASVSIRDRERGPCAREAGDASTALVFLSLCYLHGGDGSGDGVGDVAVGKVHLAVHGRRGTRGLAQGGLLGVLGRHSSTNASCH